MALVLGMALSVMWGGAARAQVQTREQSPARTGFWGRTQAPGDTLGAYTGSLWGPVPARHDSVSTSLAEPRRPAWETAVMVPYWIVGIPFRIVYLGLDQTVIGMDKLQEVFAVAAKLALLEAIYLLDLW